MALIIVDAHQDIAMNALAAGRDYREHSLVKRQREAGTEIVTREGVAMSGLPDALMGRVAVVFATLFTEPKRVAAMLGLPLGDLSYSTPKEAYTAAMKQVDYYHRLQDEEPQIRLIKRRGDLDTVLASWDDARGIDQRLHGLVMLMENGDPILEPKQFEEWYEYGVRIVGPAWAATRYSGGTREPGGLTALGIELLEFMAGLNAILDLSHMAEQAYFQALERYQGEVIIASHSNPRRFSNTDRHLSDDMIRALSARDGVIGVVPYNRFLSNTWRPGDPKAGVPLTVLVDAIDHICQITGSAAHVGIGTDFDGGFGAASTPAGIDSISDLVTIAPVLAERGYPQADIDAIMSGNFLRKLRQGLPV
ncbi:MAG: membrane dipeptidase [bacterium]|nr:membrane dipeptidase [bacterium]